MSKNVKNRENRLFRKKTPQLAANMGPPKSGNQLHIVTKEFSPGLEVKMTQILEKMSKNTKNRENRLFRKKHPNLPRIWDPQNPKIAKITFLDILRPPEITKIHLWTKIAILGG